jgi:hypothetical protein
MQSRHGTSHALFVLGGTTDLHSGSGKVEIMSSENESGEAENEEGAGRESEKK